MRHIGTGGIGCEGIGDGARSATKNADLLADQITQPHLQYIRKLLTVVYIEHILDGIGPATQHTDSGDLNW